MSFWSIVRVTKVEEYLIESGDGNDPTDDLADVIWDFDEMEVVKVLRDIENFEDLAHHFDRDKILPLDC